MAENEEDVEELLDYEGPKIIALVPPRGLRFRVRWAQDMSEQYVSQWLSDHKVDLSRHIPNMVAFLMLSDVLPEDVVTLSDCGGVEFHQLTPEGQIEFLPQIRRSR